MGWIKNRIDAEYRKHKGLDWSRIAEAKINSEIIFKLFSDIKSTQNDICNICGHVRFEHEEKGKPTRCMYGNGFGCNCKGFFKLTQDKLSGIKTARRCILSNRIDCDNKICLNKYCPLHRIYNKNQNKREPKLLVEGEPITKEKWKKFQEQNKREPHYFIEDDVLAEKQKKKGCGREFDYDDDMPITCGMEWNGRRFYCDECNTQDYCAPGGKKDV